MDKVTSSISEILNSYTGVYKERFLSGDGRINGEADNRVGRSYTGNTNTATDEVIHSISQIMRPNLRSGTMMATRPVTQVREGWGGDCIEWCNIVAWIALTATSHHRVDRLAVACALPDASPHPHLASWVGLPAVEARPEGSGAVEALGPHGSKRLGLCSVMETIPGLLLCAGVRNDCLTFPSFCVEWLFVKLNNEDLQASLLPLSLWVEGSRPR